MIGSGATRASDNANSRSTPPCIGEGGFRTNSPADQKKTIVYSELVANAVAAQTVDNLTHALNKLHVRGINIAAEDLAHFSPYPTSKVKRFGDYPAQVPVKPTGFLESFRPLHRTSSSPTLILAVCRAARR